ncbi:MAG: hypothetical protein U1E30_07045 [Rhodoblastus sp.]|jgi:hypothetical protein
MTPSRIAGSAALLVLTTGLFAGAAWLSAAPDYRQISADAAVVKLSFSHGSDRSAACRKRPPEELAKLPPNLRTPLECPRTRNPVFTELYIDTKLVYSASLPPSGLSSDGPSRVYQRFTVPAGRHSLLARLRDTPRADGFDHSIERTVDLAPGQSLAIDFRPELGGFIIR